MRLRRAPVDAGDEAAGGVRAGNDPTNFAVMPGLDPGIHAPPPQAMGGVDRRSTSGHHDEVGYPSAEIPFEEETAMSGNGQRYDVGGILLPRPFKIRRLGHFGF